MLDCRQDTLVFVSQTDHHYQVSYGLTSSPLTINRVNWERGFLSSVRSGIALICLTETWISREVPDFIIKPTGFSMHRADRIPDLSGKSKGGGVCFMINNSWCDRKNHTLYNLFVLLTWNTSRFCAGRFWLLREFTAVIITAVYIPPQADTDATLKELYRHLRCVYYNQGFQQSWS